MAFSLIGVNVGPRRLTLRRCVGRVGAGHSLRLGDPRAAGAVLRSWTATSQVPLALTAALGATRGQGRLAQMPHFRRAATQHGAQRDHEQLMDVVQAGVAASRVGQVVPARDKQVQAVLQGRKSHPHGRHHPAASRQAPTHLSTEIQMRFP